MPPPQSRERIRVSASSQSAVCLLFASTNPPGTNDLVVRSNSRTVSASSPPSESATRQRRYSGGLQLAPFHTQLAFSAAERASRSITVSQTGAAVA